MSCGNGVESQGTPGQIESAGQSTREDRAELRELHKPEEAPLRAQHNAPRCGSARTLPRVGETQPGGWEEQRQMLTHS